MELVELLIACQKNPHGPAAQELFEQLLPRAQRIARSIAWRNKSNSAQHVAEDIASEALLKLFRSIHTITDITTIDSWFTRAITRLFIDRVTSSASRSELFLDEMPDRPSRWGIPGDSMEFAEMLGPLKDDLRDVLICIYGYQLNIAETASYLSIPKGTVKSRHFIALKYLRDFLEIDRLLA